MRLDADYTREFLARVDSRLDTLEHNRNRIIKGWDRVAEIKALSGQVYKDQSNSIWYQMDAGGAIYHFGRNPRFPKIESFWQSKKRGQKDTPVFKLVSPDGTGGSSETILRNVFYQSDVVVQVNKFINVGYLIVTDYWLQGSYNFSETIDAGFSSHNMRDILPHEKYPYPNVYINPSDRFSPLSARVFPEKMIGEGNLLAKQI